MKIEFRKASPNKNSINAELDFSFYISDIERGEFPLGFSGTLFSEDGLKLADLTAIEPEHLNLHLNAEGAVRAKRNNDFMVHFSATLSPEAINHIEDFRTKMKEKTKDVVLRVAFRYKCLLNEMELAHIHQGHGVGRDDEKKYGLFYKYDPNFSGGGHSGLWLLSGSDSSAYLNYRTFEQSYDVKIGLMDWINDFAPYLNIGSFMVYEFLTVEETVFNKTIQKRYEKAQQALKEMKRQMEYGEWKAAIKACRPVFELFKNFDDFKKFLLDHGYSQPAYENLRKSIQEFFSFLSKFDHALTLDRKEVSPEITAYKEDANMAYSFCINLLHLISQKEKRGT